MRLLGAEVRRCRLRQPDAQGRDQRGAARLGDQRAHDPLHPRLGARPRSVPAHGARLPSRDRRGGAGPAPAPERPSADAGDRLRRRRHPTRSACSRRSSTTHGVRLIGVEAGGTRPAPRRARGALRAGRRRRRRAPRHADLRAPGRDGQIAEHALGLGRARLSGGRPRARAAARARPRRVHLAPATPRRSPPSTGWRARRDPAGARERARRRRGAAERAPAAARRLVLVNLSGAATRTWSRCASSASRARAGREARDERRSSGGDASTQRSPALAARSGRPSSRSSWPAIPTSSDQPAPGRGRGGRRRRHHRARRAVQRSDRRRPGQPARRRCARSASGTTLAGDPVSGARGPSPGRRRPSSCSPTSTRSTPAASSASPRGAAASESTACSASTCRPRRPRPNCDRPRRHGIDAIFLLAPTEPEERRIALPPRLERLRLLRLAHRRDRRADEAAGEPAARGASGQAAASSCRSRSASASRRPSRWRRWRESPTAWSSGAPWFGWSRRPDRGTTWWGGCGTRSGR